MPLLHVAVWSYDDGAERLPFARNGGALFRRAPQSIRLVAAERSEAALGCSPADEAGDWSTPLLFAPQGLTGLPAAFSGREISSRLGCGGRCRWWEVVVSDGAEAAHPKS